MCGITGIVTRGGAHLEDVARAMTACLNHRGPDAAGIWIEPEAGLAFGHTRLSIIDLSELGAQPMHSASGRFVISYNGEIYNYQALSEELRNAGHKFRGGSDTEVLLAAFEEWGVEAALKRCNGMFAVALWDRKERMLSLARDRLGKKPLYYGWTKEGFVFGSELKSLKVAPGFNPEIDRESIAIQLRHNYIPAPWSIYRGIYKIPPGSYFSLRLEHLLARPIAFQPEVVSDPGIPGPKSFWSLAACAEAEGAGRAAEDDSRDLSELENLVRDAVRVRMIADVPLGAFLSGGVDSSLVVALMQEQSSRKVKTFSVGFDVAAFDETNDAARVAKHLGTEHHEFRMTPVEALEVIPKLPFLYDEPFSDSSQIPTYLVSKFARESVTVALSGDGGDECFGGYNRYSWAKKIWQSRMFAPWPLNAAVGAAIRSLSPLTWDRILSVVGRRTPAYRQGSRFGHRMYRLADFLQAENPAELYRVLISHWENGAEIVLGATGTRDIILNQPAWNMSLDYIRQMMLVDQVTYLPADILAKVDRASMGVSLEVRCPLLDYRVVEHSWKLPTSTLIRNGDAKWPLKQLLYKYVPRELVDRPKMGFGVPIERWLSGPLREWAEDLLNPRAMQQQGFLNADLIQTRWQEFRSGRRPWDQHIWDVLMFQSWLANFHESKVEPRGATDVRVIPFKRAG